MVLVRYESARDAGIEGCGYCRGRVRWADAAWGGWGVSALGLSKFSGRHALSITFEGVHALGVGIWQGPQCPAF